MKNDRRKIQIKEYVHDEVIAFSLAFKTLGGEHTPDDDISYSNDHYELESRNPADAIQVATFLKNKQVTPNENIKKRYLYVCKFTDKLAGEEGYLLFSIFWDADFGCWNRLPDDCCCGASSLEDAANWMLKRITTKGDFVDYFKKGKLEIKIGQGDRLKKLLAIKELRIFLTICLYVMCVVFVFSGFFIFSAPVILLPFYYLKKHGYYHWLERILFAFFGPFFTLHYIFFKFFGGTEYYILKLSISGIISVCTFIYSKKINFYFDSIFDLNYKSLFKKSSMKALLLPKNKLGRLVVNVVFILFWRLMFDLLYYYNDWQLMDPDDEFFRFCLVYLLFFAPIFFYTRYLWFEKSRHRIFYGIPEQLFKKFKFNLKQFNSEVFNTTSNADELKKYAELRDQGVISEEEFQAKKKILLDL